MVRIKEKKGEEVTGFTIKLKKIVGVSQKPINSYVLFKLGGYSCKSKVVKKDCNPIFDEVLFVPFSYNKDNSKKIILSVEVWSKKKKVFKTKKMFIGKIDINFSEMSIHDKEAIKIQRNLERTAAKIAIDLKITSFGVDIDNNEGLKKQKEPKRKKEEDVLDEQRNTSVQSITTEEQKQEENESISSLPSVTSPVTETTLNTEQIKSKEKGYEVLKHLGKGGFGEVDLIQMVKSNELFAMKRIYCKTKEEVNRSMKEVFLLRDFNHKGLVNYTDIFFEDHENSIDFKYSICLTMKYYKLGDFQKFLENRQKSMVPLDQKVVESYFLQLIEALEYIHSKKLLHRDLKPANIFMDNNYKKLLIGDFGLVHKLAEGISSSKTGIAGTRKYLAPECLDGDQIAPRKEVDIWALGCIFYFICTLSYDKTFYLEAYKNKNFYKEMRIKIEKVYAKEIADIVIGMLDTNPKERLTSFQIKTILEDLKGGDNKRSMGQKVDDIFELEKDFNIDLESEKSTNSTSNATNEIIKLLQMKKINQDREKMEEIKKIEVEVETLKKEIGDMEGNVREKYEPLNIAFEDLTTVKVHDVKKYKEVYGDDGGITKFREFQRQKAMFLAYTSNIKNYSGAIFQTIKTYSQMDYYHQVKSLSMCRDKEQVIFLWENMKRGLVGFKTTIEQMIPRLDTFLKEKEKALKGMEENGIDEEMNKLEKEENPSSIKKEE